MGNTTSNEYEPSALGFMLETCSDMFFSYLSNKEIGKLDNVLTDVSLRNIYLSKVKDFYVVNKIYTRMELEWILARHISLTKCHLEFEIKGKKPR